MKRESRILLVEDDENDMLLIQRALSKAGLPKAGKIFRNGEEAIFYLEGAHPFANRDLHPLPDLILLDLKLPHMSGLEVLKWIRSQPDLGGIPVVVLTSSADVRDSKLAYDLGADSFLTKPLDFANAASLAGTLHAKGLGEARARRKGA